MKCPKCGYEVEKGDCPLCTKCKKCGKSVRDCDCIEGE